MAFGPRLPYGSKNQEITQDELKSFFEYNKLTGKFTRLVAAGRELSGSVASCIDSDGYIRIGINGRVYLAHCLAWLYVTGVFPKISVNHLNGIKTDNSFDNLRLASRSEIAANSKISSRNSSGFKGVSFNKTKGKYKACVVKNGKQIHIGYFSTALEAHRERSVIFQRLFGQFAREK